MAALKDQLRTDLTTAMKARDEVRTRTLRMALTAVSTAEVAGSTSRELSDDEVIKVLAREAKRRREAADAFAAAGRAEQASAERAEGEVLDEYLPAQLGDDETAGSWRPGSPSPGRRPEGHGPGHEGGHAADRGARGRRPGGRRGPPPARRPVGTPKAGTPKVACPAGQPVATGPAAG